MCFAQHCLRLVLVKIVTKHRTVGTNRVLTIWWLIMTRKTDVVAQAASSGTDHTDRVGTDHTVLIGGRYRPPHGVLIIFFFFLFLKFI
jgi:hypothetical protein